MLLNNLDAEVAEHPERASRLRRLRQGGPQPRCAEGDRSLACSSSVRTRPSSSRAASRWASSGRTAALRACSSRTRCSCPAGQRGTSSAGSRREGLTMFGQMTAGSWIYIGTQGILQGTYQTFAAAGEIALRLVRPEREDDPHGGPRRDGRRPAARRDDGGRRDPLRRGRSDPDRAAACDPLPRRVVGVARRRGRAGAGGGEGRAGALGRPPGQRRRGRPGARPPRRFASTS